MTAIDHALSYYSLSDSWKHTAIHPVFLFSFAFMLAFQFERLLSMTPSLSYCFHQHIKLIISIMLFCSFQTVTMFWTVSSSSQSWCSECICSICWCMYDFYFYIGTYCAHFHVKVGRKCHFPPTPFPPFAYCNPFFNDHYNPPSTINYAVKNLTEVSFDIYIFKFAYLRISLSLSHARLFEASTFWHEGSSKIVVKELFLASFAMQKNFRLTGCDLQDDPRFL